MRELSEHILDILYNSLEAGAQRIRVAVIEDSRADRLTLIVADDGRGMTAEQAQRVLDPFYTSRTTRKVGLGLPLLAERARACEGDVVVESAPGHGTTVTTTMQLSHVDRQPLGDMAATWMVALVAAPDADYEYRHEVDGRVFAFTAAQIREEAGEIPFSDPALAQWLREWIGENVAALGGRA